MSSEDLKKIFDESIGSTKAYLICTSGNKLGIIDRLTRTLKENIRKYRASAGTLGNLQSMIDTVINLYNDSPHRGIQGKTQNEMWDNIKEQQKRNIIDTMSNDKTLKKIDPRNW